ncbi:hypothetical protein T484DRAFT_1865645 [Baffinella frigidus]|nr:hypothetical protein T484DRAFT_1865645 [Cryptophyta sp. CCMP2293]
MYAKTGVALALVGRASAFSAPMALRKSLVAVPLMRGICAAILPACLARAPFARLNLSQLPLRAPEQGAHTGIRGSSARQPRPLPEWMVAAQVRQASN